MANCKIENCDNEAHYPILGVCRTCYSGLRYWNGRGLRDKRARLKQVMRLTSRMEYMIVGDVPAGATPITRAKRRSKK